MEPQSCGVLLTLSIIFAYEKLNVWMKQMLTATLLYVVSRYVLVALMPTLVIGMWPH